MNPTNNPSNQPTEPVAPNPDPASAPQPPVAPTVTPTGTPTQPYAPVQQPALQPSPAPAGNSKRLKIVLLSLAGFVVLALIVLSGLWFSVFSPAARSARVSNAFMAAMTKNDLTTAGSYAYGGNDSGTKAFLTSIAPALKGGTAKVSMTVLSHDVRYTNYTVTNARQRYARVTVIKDNGKWVARGLATSNSPLELLAPIEESTPATKSSTNTNSTTAPKTKTGTLTTADCLQPSDYKALVSFNVTRDSFGLYTYTDSIFFTANSTNYAYPSLMPDKYAKYSAFAKQTTAKQYTIQLTGEVNGTADANLASQRVAVVKAALVQAGFPDSRIVVSDTKNYNGSASGSNGSENRNVDVKFASPSACANI